MEHLLNQSAILRLKIGKTGYGTLTHDEGTQVDIRWQDSIKIIKNKDGEEVTSTAFIWALTPMRIDDILVYKEKDWPIKQVEEVPDYDGNIHHWEVYL